jgi:CRISPR-associated protein (Cas_Cmr3).
MLRFLILSNNKILFSISNNKIIADKDEVQEEIGENSFHLNNRDYSKIDFKKIHSLSPCFLQRKTNTDWVNLFCSSLDYDLKKVSLEKGQSLLETKSNYIPVIDGYKAKDGLKTFYLGDNLPLEESKLFAEDVRIGINKDYSGKTQDNAFYKQIFYRLADKYKKAKDNEELMSQKLRFAFYAMLDYNFDKEKYIVSLGADNSRFILQAQCIEENTQTKCLTEDLKRLLPGNYFKTDNFDCHSKIMLLSDAFLEKQDIEDCIFSINDTVCFRFLISSVNTENYYRFTGEKRLKRSNKKYNLYRKGSVFYFDNEKSLEAFEKALQTKERFYQIGYNYYFKTIKK